MKNLLFILLGVLFALNINAQNPVAVNDTFYTNFETPKTILRNDIILNDNVSGTIKIIDTVIYSGISQITPLYTTGSTSWLGLQNVVFTPQVGFFGLDSITYVLTDEVIPSLYDTAKIYIYVKVNSYNLDLNNVSARIDPEVLFQNREVSPAISAFNVPKQDNIGIDPYLVTIYAS
jgi:Big-like domain-containing protein